MSTQLIENLPIKRKKSPSQTSVATFLSKDKIYKNSVYEFELIGANFRLFKADEVIKNRGNKKDFLINISKSVIYLYIKTYNIINAST